MYICEFIHCKFISTFVGSGGSGLCSVLDFKLKQFYSYMCGDLICCRYDVGAFLSHRWLKSGDLVMNLDFHLILLKSLYDKDI